ncbi:GIY-YIG nuclease family protein [Altibacter sp. HG106]|uniref:GIY-YIG nuclease family protein n=1 Tax=Altibacter sp. HG106 TaxID=3023937 RepID=UPI002350AAE7|nr:GIY-YIG nuclease family protein [Altibacter sp. HG106]MDC7994324.1 GIY-YIG nuclease family protein [Altibacter sp. HG106]
MEEYVVYILDSETAGKVYTGFTSNLISRMLSHNKLGKGWTVRYGSWWLFTFV